MNWCGKSSKSINVKCSKISSLSMSWFICTSTQLQSNLYIDSVCCRGFGLWSKVSKLAVFNIMLWIEWFQSFLWNRANNGRLECTPVQSVLLSKTALCWLEQYKSEITYQLYLPCWYKNSCSYSKARGICFLVSVGD